MTSAAAIRYDWPFMGWTWQEIIKATGAAGADAGPSFDAITTDSRRVAQGALFIALRGERHDGHRFAADALRQGAAAVLVEKMPPEVDRRRALQVPDTQRALGDLAAHVRRRRALRVVGITGSNGKTTTKEMAAAICGRAFSAAAVLKTQGNENNLIGLPLTLLRLAAEQTVAVLEMGMNAPGEIARLTDIAAPDLGLVTNVGPAHLEGLGSIAGVAAAKGELFAHMPPTGTIAVNAADEWVVRQAASFPGRRIEFGPGREVESRAVRERDLDAIEFELVVSGRSAAVRLPMAGPHNVLNALAAAAAAHGLGIDLEAIAAGLAAVEAPKMRMQVIRLANGVTLVNDGYNANPASMEAGLRAIRRVAPRAVAVLGEMRELGPQGAALHRALGAAAAQIGIDVVVAVGPMAEETAAGARAGSVEVFVCPDGRTAAERVVALWRPGDVILVKASRGPDTDPAVVRYGARMAEVVALLEEAGGRS
jgi:UDP-N-acetylmuramoyl-tripeptide--D-alanyl-D-alanine ligase